MLYFTALRVREEEMLSVDSEYHIVLGRQAKESFNITGFLLPLPLPIYSLLLLRGGVEAHLTTFTYGKSHTTISLWVQLTAHGEEFPQFRNS